jgi:hypothetical protein
MLEWRQAAYGRARPTLAESGAIAVNEGRNSRLTRPVVLRPKTVAYTEVATVSGTAPALTVLRKSLRRQYPLGSSQQLLICI